RSPWPSARRRGRSHYFETCRRERNVIDYTRSHVAADTQADEILNKAREFYDLVEAWIASKFPALRSDSHRRSCLVRLCRVAARESPWQAGHGRSCAA